MVIQKNTFNINNIYKLHNWINIESLDWIDLCRNPNAIHIIENNINIYNHNNISRLFLAFGYLSANPNAIHLLEQYPNLIEWHYLSKNPNAIHLLEQNITKIY